MSLCMFCMGRKSMINPEMSKYIRQQTNIFTTKTLATYLKNDTKNLVTTDDKTSPICCHILPFVSLFSFIFGYNFCYYTIK